MALDTNTVTLPRIPTSQIFVNGIMVLEWQNFFRDLLTRIGGYDAPNNFDIGDAIDALLNLDPSLLVATDADGEVISVPDLTAWIAQTANQVIVTDDGDGTVKLSTPQDIDIDADLILGSADIILSLDQIGLNIKGYSSQTEHLTTWTDSSDTVLAQIQANGRIYTSTGVKADAITGGGSLMLWDSTGLVIDHQYTASGNYDLAGGTYESLFTDTTNSPFTQSDADDVKWIIIRSGTYKGAMAEIMDYIDSDNVILHTMGWTFDLTNVDYYIVNHPAVVIGDGYHNEIQVNASGHFDIHSVNWVGNDYSSYMTEIELDAGANSLTALQVEADLNGYAEVRGIRSTAVTGDLQNGERFANIVSNINVTNATGDATAGTAGFTAFLIGESDMTNTGFICFPGHTNAFRVIGAEWEDPGYGYEITVTTVADRVNGTPQDGTAFLDTSTSNLTIFDNDDDYILIGSDNTFEMLEVILDTASSKDIVATFEYSTGSGTWTSFTPDVETTGGFTNNGVISWMAADLAGWAKGDTAEVAADITNAYYIKITRTYALNIPTEPIESYFKISPDQDVGMLIRGDGIVQLSYLSAAPANLVNGMMWMESDGLHIYYAGAEKTVAGV